MNCGRLFCRTLYNKKKTKISTFKHINNNTSYKYELIAYRIFNYLWGGDKKQKTTNFSFFQLFFIRIFTPFFRQTYFSFITKQWKSFYYIDYFSIFFPANHLLHMNFLTKIYFQNKARLFSYQLRTNSIVYFSFL